MTTFAPAGLRYTAPMLKLLRYTLAATFLAASVGCLGLWGWSSNRPKQVQVAGLSSSAIGVLCIEFQRGYLATAFLDSLPLTPPYSWETLPEGFLVPKLDRSISRSGRFGAFGEVIHFPLWYPALVFALAAVGVLRLGKPFTIRSALIATTVVAVLLGMVVAL